MKYRIGEVLNPVQSDPFFETEAEAIEAARPLANSDPTTPYAVWETKDFGIVRLFLGGQEFRGRN